MSFFEQKVSFCLTSYLVTLFNRQNETAWKVDFSTWHFFPFKCPDQGIHKTKSCMKWKRRKFWSNSMEHFIENKPLISEKCIMYFQSSGRFFFLENHRRIYSYVFLDMTYKQTKTYVNDVVCPTVWGILVVNTWPVNEKCR